MPANILIINEFFMVLGFKSDGRQRYLNGLSRRKQGFKSPWGRHKNHTPY